MFPDFSSIGIHPSHANGETQVTLEPRSMANPTRSAAKDFNRKQNEGISVAPDSLGEKMETRLPIAMVVSWAPAQNRNGTKLTCTDNMMLTAHV